jgi:uncharacterized membrane protein (DUF373 family)
MNIPSEESLVEKVDDPIILFLNKLVVVGVKALAVLIVAVIWLAIVDVVWHLYLQLEHPISGLFYFDNLIATLGDFLMVLIAVEIYLNIIFYLKKDAIHVPLVLSTALTAAARKVIVLDYKDINPLNVLALAAILLALGLTYWLVTKKN